MKNDVAKSHKSQPKKRNRSNTDQPTSQQKTKKQQSRTSTSSKSKSVPSRLEISDSLGRDLDNEFIADLRLFEKELGISDEASLRAFEKEMLEEEGEDMLSLLSLTDGIIKGERVDSDDSEKVFSDEEIITSASVDGDAVLEDADSREEMPSIPSQEPEEGDHAIINRASTSTHKEQLTTKKSKKKKSSTKSLENTFAILETWLGNLERLNGQSGFKTALKSNLNKVSEGNMDIILKEILAIPKCIMDFVATPMNVAVSKGRLKAEDKDLVNLRSITMWCSYHLAEFAHTLSIANQMTTPSLISTTVAFCLGCCRSNPNFSLFAARFIQLCQATLSTGLETLTAVSRPKDFESVRFECRSVIQAVALAFDFGLVDHATLFEVIKVAGGPVPAGHGGMDESRADLILILLKFSDNGLKRTVCKSVIQEIFDFIGARMPKVIEADVVSRRQFLLEEISKMRDGDTSSIYGNERFDFVRNWSTRLGASSFEPLPLKWLDGLPVDDLARKSEGGAINLDESGKKIVSKKQEFFDSVAHSDKHEKLLLAAAALKLHSPVQRMVFIALMGAVDTDDAVERVGASTDIKKDAPTIVSVILLVASKTGKFNDYYLKVLRELCVGGTVSAAKNAFKQAVKKALAASLSAVGSSTKLENQLLGRTVSYLSWVEVISLSQLRFIDLKHSKETLKEVVLSLSEYLVQNENRSIQDLIKSKGQEKKGILDLDDICLLLSSAADDVIAKLDGDKKRTNILNEATKIKNSLIR
eukprot:GHVH01004681.1.p1 GENE.GHVH01004681.1~~GHVH01004681.1.p1  ORF type:complete len:776 (-),score=142.61 GHVH01004681.1:36-2309(-)